MATVSEVEWKTAQDEIKRLKEGYEKVFTMLKEQETQVKKQAGVIVDKQAELQKMKDDKTSESTPKLPVDEGKGKIRGFDTRNLIRPSLFDNKIEEFIPWHEVFTTQLIAIDDQWLDLLHATRSHHGKVMTKATELQMFDDLNIQRDQMEKINRMMYVSLLQYTTGQAKAKAISNGSSKALDTYRHLLYKFSGESNIVHIMKVKNRAMNPERASKVE